MEIIPQAAVIPKDTTQLAKGKYGPIFPKMPACYGFTIIANVKPGTAETIRGYGVKLAKALETDPQSLAPLKLHYLRWVLFDNDTRFMYQGIFDTDFDKYTEDAVALFRRAGVDTVVREPRGLPGRLEDQHRLPSSGSSAIISATASWNTASTPYARQRRDQEGTEHQSGIVGNARADAVEYAYERSQRQRAPTTKITCRAEVFEAPPPGQRLRCLELSG